MNRSPALVEIHFALWAVLSVPVGFAGVFFLVPGLMIPQGAALLAISALLVVYISRLTRLNRLAWLLGLIAHAALVAAAAFYVPRWPALLAVPLALANLYSLGVLLAYRRLWSAAAASPAPEVAAGP